MQPFEGRVIRSGQACGGTEQAHPTATIGAAIAQVHDQFPGFVFTPSVNPTAITSRSVSSGVWVRATQSR
ncbi:hypothetical protein [Gordonia sp. (in: high G+C Gram-positive bacteria)]|uniref:hypothetical protein n=1 Tax=Gordonia sp. (in: high G+C Gram-positive bacteria) TaxID=84139 RepID=UPI001D7C0A6D|nr:hypothetical protein [Gordonia sp. (in: high G+C Gram-positive bacteria)]